MKHKSITEKDKRIITGWFETADKMANTGPLADFVGHLISDYDHDYGTICHAITAAGIAAMRCVDNSPVGGITGFQASCIFWEFLDHWHVFDKGPKRIMLYANMLYPQYEHKFAKTINKETWEWLRAEAKKKLKTEPNGWHPDIRAHIESVAAGKIPFGYVIAED